MNQLLTPGQRINTQFSVDNCKIEKFLGSGAQGEVYQVSWVDQPVALKWYFPQYVQHDTTLRERIQRIIKEFRTAPNDRFLWPLELAFQPSDTTTFGYLMPLREPRFKGMADLMTRQIEPSFRALITAGIELAESYRKLHAAGLCYRDISFGNVFFDPANGEVRICDNDNVDINHAAGAIGGTMRFMAPEIVRGEATPDTQTDLFSLAVLLFYLLFNHHPLEGKRESAIRCFDLPAMTQLYGKAPRFIFDPNDDSNRPVPGEHDNALAFWAIYPAFLRNLFTRAFTAGSHDPQRRVREGEWRSVLIRLRDALLYCPHCQAENFYDVDQLRSTRQSPLCWACQQMIQLPPRLRLQHAGETQIIMLNHDTQLYPYHLDSSQEFTVNASPAAAVTQHPTNPQIWGLQNLSSSKWVATTSEGNVRDVPPGRSITLASGTRLQFGASEGEIRM
ncbi:MAG: hypothetical protein U0350_02225 [Caldilineaceae bacterium]